MTTASSPRTARELTRLAGTFRGLADLTRLRILAMLGRGEVCVCEIHEGLKIPQPRASRHLAYLRRAGLVTARRQGLWMYYRLADHRDPVLKTLVNAVTHCLDHLNDALPAAHGKASLPCACCAGEADRKT